MIPDMVIGLLINKVEFRLDIHAKIQVWPTTKFALYAQQQEKTWRIVGFVSSAIIQERIMTEAFAYGKHFSH